MTNELEKQFFDTFGIEPIRYKRNVDDNAMLMNKVYPQITDCILLELLVVMTRYTDIIEGFDSVQELKEFVLKDLMYSLTQPECDIVKHQVRTLFEDE